MNARRVNPRTATGYTGVPAAPAGHHGLTAMSGPQHAKEAESLLNKARYEKNETTKANLLAEAQVHATLAAVAAMVYSGSAAKDQTRPWDNHGVRA